MKNLSAALDARQQEVVSLKKEIEALKRVPPPEPPAVETPRPDRAVEMEEEPAAPAAEETRPAPPKETGDTEDADEKKGSQY